MRSSVGLTFLFTRPHFLFSWWLFFEVIPKFFNIKGSFFKIKIFINRTFSKSMNFFKIKDQSFNFLFLLFLFFRFRRRHFYQKPRKNQNQPRDHDNTFYQNQSQNQDKDFAYTFYFEINPFLFSRVFTV